MNLLALDSRWRRFNDQTRACPCCGQSFNGIFDIGYDHPDDWPHAPRNHGEDVIADDDKLGSDFCTLKGRYFIRSVLHLPVRGAEDAFGYGPWVEVSMETMRAYGATYGKDPQPFEGEGLLANALPLFEDELGTALRLSCPDPSQRALVEPLDGPLAEAQAKGISFDQLLDIYAACGTDIRPHLSTD